MTWMRILVAAAAILVAAGGTGGTLLVTQPWAGPGTAPYIVVGDPIEAALEALDIEPSFVYRHALRGFAADLSDEQAETLVEAGLSVQEDREVNVFDDALATGIDRVDADRYWAEEGGTSILPGRPAGAGITVAVVDTGILPLMDLNINTALSKDFTGNPNGWRDGYGHGTHVAGIIASKDDGAGVIGVAPKAELVALKALNDSGSGYTSTIIAALDWALQHRGEIDVVNMSLGAQVLDWSTCPTSQAFHQTICNVTYSGIVVVVAAGNLDIDAAHFIPATYDEVLTVSALADSDGEPGGAGPGHKYGPDDTLASFSNWGRDVDLAAPGVDILSYWGDSLEKKSGTSMASPHVAGLAALHIEAHGRPADYAGVLAVHEALKGQAFPQNSPCGFAGDRDAFPEPLAHAAVHRDDCESGPAPTPTPSPIPTATPIPPSPPSGLTARTECPGDEVNVILSWHDNSANEQWFGVWVTEGEGYVWRGSVEPDATRFLWPMGEPGRSHYAIVGAYILNVGYVYSGHAQFTVSCDGAPTPSPTATPSPTPSPTSVAPVPSPTPACPELDTLRELLCEAIEILYPGWGPCTGTGLGP